MRTRLLRAFHASLTLLVIAACGPSSSARSSPFALEARVGIYDDGSGRLGTALVATLRDAGGAGPSSPWTITVRDGSGITVAALQSVTGPGAYMASWYADAAPSPGSYQVVAENGQDSVRASVSLDAGSSSLPLPAPVVAADGSRIDWAPVTGAAAYICRVYTAGALQLDTAGSGTSCDLSALPPGAYSASVLAVSADLAPIAASSAMVPPLPPTFDVSEARLGLGRVAGAPPVVLRAVGGAYDNGIGARSLAVWLSISAADGSATASTWDVQVVGPNLPASAPLALTYYANFPRTLTWAPGIPAAQGTYTVTAQSGATAVVGQFTVGSPPWLDQPLGLVASDGSLGSASASWSPVVGAKSYLLAAYDGAGALAASAWFGGTSGSFPQGTFAAGATYDVFVAATDADMAGGAIPTQVSVVENVFDFSSFVAR